jgi:adenylosuccinate lyase
MLFTRRRLSSSVPPGKRTTTFSALSLMTSPWISLPLVRTMMSARRGAEKAEKSASAMASRPRSGKRRPGLRRSLAVALVITSWLSSPPPANLIPDRGGQRILRMPEPAETYSNPLAERYASREMLEIFSDRRRYGTWRRLWVALAEVEAELGLDIRAEQIEEMRARVDDIDFERVAEIERELRHDVMAHITHFGEQCPRAKPIIHLGATSCFVTDNTDLMLMRAGLELVRARLAELLRALGGFALRHRSLPALAYTHFQPAQLTTVGKRAALWAQDFLLDLEEVERWCRRLRFRGAKGTTGTQASFLRLFDGDAAKVEELDRRISERMGFEELFLITGQTYTRKQDEAVLHALAGVAQSAHKFSNDLRLLQGLGEIEEPFGDKQVGSSAMPYKRNPMRLERISSLAKYAMCEAQNAGWVHATQWFERTLDDSANRRLSIPQCFLAADAILILALNVSCGLVVHPAVIRRRLEEELASIASENLMMLAVRAGGDRGRLHERIREHAMKVAEARRAGAAQNDLLERLAADPLFASVRERIGEVSDPAAYVGRAPEQVEKFFRDEVDPLLERIPRPAGGPGDVSV